MRKLMALMLMVLIGSFICMSCGDSDTPRSRNGYDDEEDEDEEENNNKKPTTSEDPDDDTKRVKLPDVSGTDFDSAKAVLISKGFLITVEEDYSDSVKEGDVIGTNPKGGTMLEENSKVVLIVSKGPSLVECKDATISWYHIDSSSPDEWNFGGPFIYQDKLYIQCETVFGTEFTFKGKGFGDASITDTFDKKAPITILDTSLKERSENKQVKKGEKEEFVLCIPLAQLDAARPTHVACELIILVGDKEKHISVSFNISW